MYHMDWQRPMVAIFPHSLLTVSLDLGKQWCECFKDNISNAEDGDLSMGSTSRKAFYKRLTSYSTSFFLPELWQHFVSFQIVDQTWGTEEWKATRGHCSNCELPTSWHLIIWEMNICHIQATIFRSPISSQVYFLTNTEWNNYRKLEGLNYVLQTLNLLLELRWERLWVEDLTSKEDFTEGIWVG